MIFKVQVLDGRGFVAAAGAEAQQQQALVCACTFGGSTKTTQYSLAPAAGAEPLWNSTLTWEVSREELRSATSNTNHCKISVLRRDGSLLGWVVISLRSAKLQRQYKSHADGEPAGQSVHIEQQVAHLCTSCASCHHAVCSRPSHPHHRALLTPPRTYPAAALLCCPHLVCLQIMPCPLPLLNIYRLVAAPECHKAARATLTEGGVLSRRRAPPAVPTPLSSNSRTTTAAVTQQQQR